MNEEISIENAHPIQMSVTINQEIEGGVVTLTSLLLRKGERIDGKSSEHKDLRAAARVASQVIYPPEIALEDALSSLFG